MDLEKRKAEMDALAREMKDIPISKEAILVAKGFQVAAEVLKASTRTEKDGKVERA